MTSAPHSSNLLFRLWHWSQKRRAVGRYIKILPRRLFEDYGHRGPYTPTQVEATIRRHKVSTSRYSDYAVALFCDRTRLKQFQSEDNRATGYDAIRRDLADTYFFGDADFTFRDVARSSAERGGGDHETGHGEVGGHHGGDGGGGHH